MWSVQEDDVTSADKPVNKKTKKISFKGPQRIATGLSPFVEQDLVLQIENTKLHLVKDQLMKESPVFNRMLTSDFKEKDEKEIKLDGKNLNDFVEFLRCTLPGIDEDVNDKTVHVILPLADEYQRAKTLKKANQFLAKKSKFLGDKISSAQVIQNILEAELYRLGDYLDESIAIASRKCFERLVQHPKFKEMTQETRLKIMTKRWKDMDEVFKTTGHMQYVTGCVDFYQELSLTNNITPTTSECGFGSNSGLSGSTSTGGFGKSSSTFGLSKSTSRISGVSDLGNYLKPFIQNNLNIN